MLARSPSGFPNSGFVLVVACFLFLLRETERERERVCVCVCLCACVCVTATTKTKKKRLKKGPVLHLYKLPIQSFEYTIREHKADKSPMWSCFCSEDIVWLKPNGTVRNDCAIKLRLRKLLKSAVRMIFRQFPQISSSWRGEGGKQFSFVYAFP